MEKNASTKLVIIYNRARPIYRSADIYRPITRLADISYRPFSTDKLSAINKNVLFTILLINVTFFGAFASAVAHTFKHENDALERACTHTQMTSRTFKFLEYWYMHINVWNKNMPNNCLWPLTWGNTFDLCNTTDLWPGLLSSTFGQRSNKQISTVFCAA